VTRDMEGRGGIAKAEMLAPALRGYGCGKSWRPPLATFGICRNIRAEVEVRSWPER